MKREEIEQLLAEYMDGSITPAGSQKLEELFKQDPALQQEASEMLDVWKSLNTIEEHTQPGTGMDAQFYDMLKREKTNQHKPAAVISINRTWLRAAAAVIICCTAFGIGRFTAPPVPVFKYKTVYVRQPIIQQQIVRLKPSIVKPAKQPLTRSLKKPETRSDNSILAQQLRSVYASERIAAVMKITGKANLNNADLRSLELALKEDPNPNVRLTILNALRPLAKQTEVQQVLISALNQQGDLMVQSSIVDMLVDVKSKQAIPQMIVLLDDKRTDIMVQNKIKGGIESFIN